MSRVPPAPEPGVPVPEPRRVQLERVKLMPPPLMLKVPAVSLTTWSAGQAASALLMAPVSSPPLGESVRKIVVRKGIPPTAFRPGFQVVRRLAAMIVPGTGGVTGVGTGVATKVGVGTGPGVVGTGPGVVGTGVGLAATV